MLESTLRAIVEVAIVNKRMPPHAMRFLEEAFDNNATAEVALQRLRDEAAIYATAGNNDEDLLCSSLANLVALYTYRKEVRK